MPNGALGYRTACCSVCKNYANSRQNGYRTRFATDSMGTERGPEGTERHAALHRNYANSKQDGSRTLSVAGNMGTEICVQCAKMLQLAGNMGTENCFQCAKMLQVAGNMGTEMRFPCAKMLQLAGLDELPSRPSPSHFSC